MIANLGHKRSYVGMKPTPATIAFGNRLTRAIDDRGLSQNELSRRTGLAQGVISGYTKGTRRAYFDQAASLASAIGVSLDSLCGLQREEPAITPEEQTLLDVIRRSGRSPVEVLAILGGGYSIARLLRRTSHGSTTGHHVQARRFKRAKSISRYGLPSLSRECLAIYWASKGGLPCDRDSVAC